MANTTSTKGPLPLAVRRSVREIGAKTQAWRKLRGLTQAQLAERAGVSRDTVVRFERGDGAVSLEIVLKLLHALGILDTVNRAVDPYESDVGRLRSEQQLPQRVRPRDLTRSDDDRRR
jgi:transcriptional regulator with XRE-family HTH domain